MVVNKESQIIYLESLSQSGSSYRWRHLRPLGRLFEAKVAVH